MLFFSLFSSGSICQCMWTKRKKKNYDETKYVYTLRLKCMSCCLLAACCYVCCFCNAYIYNFFLLFFPQCTYTYDVYIYFFFKICSRLCFNDNHTQSQHTRFIIIAHYSVGECLKQCQHIGKKSPFFIGLHWCVRVSRWVLCLYMYSKTKRQNAYCQRFEYLVHETQTYYSRLKPDAYSTTKYELTLSIYTFPMLAHHTLHRPATCILDTWFYNLFWAWPAAFPR